MLENPVQHPLTRIDRPPAGVAKARVPLLELEQTCAYRQTTFNARWCAHAEVTRMVLVPIDVDEAGCLPNIVNIEPRAIERKHIAAAPATSIHVAASIQVDGTDASHLSPGVVDIPDALPKHGFGKYTRVVGTRT